MATVAAPTISGRRRRRLTRTRRFQHAGPFTYLFLLVIAVLSLFPLYWSVVVASHDNSAISDYPPVMTPGHELWRNISRVFNSGEVNIDFWTALTNSAIVSGVIAASVVLFSTLAGFAFAKLRFRGNKVLMLVVVGTLIVPVQLGVIPLYIEMKHLHWINHLQAVIAPALVSAFGVFLMRQYIVASVSNELIDASRVDGCHTLRVFWHVVLPVQSRVQPPFGHSMLQVLLPPQLAVEPVPSVREQLLPPAHSTCSSSSGSASRRAPPRPTRRPSCCGARSHCGADRHSPTSSSKARAATTSSG